MKGMKMRLLKFIYLHYGLLGVFVLSNPLCPQNIKVCYNCKVNGSCVMMDQVEIGLTEEECVTRLDPEVTWSVEYDSLTGVCSPSNCDDHIVYMEGSVVHRKTCETECGDFTLTMSAGYQVSSSITHDFYHHGMSLVPCLSVCLTTNDSCTVMYDHENVDCWVYIDCLDICDLEKGQGSDKSVHKRQCEPKGTTNVALNKSTSMSSLWTDWGETHIYRSPLGVDGDTTQNKYEDTCFVTDGEVGPWWRVDMEGLYRIHRVVIYNRLDSNSDRAHDIVLSVGKTVSDLVVKHYLPSLFSTYPFTFNSGAVAQFVQLQINATYAEHFHLCEIQVYGVPECGSARKPINGSVHTEDTTFGHYAEYTCSTGFILNGNSTRKCQSSGSWTGTDPTCEIVNCGPLSNPSDGSVTVSDSTYMGIATYSCFTGFSLIGSATRVCMSDGNWNGSDPSCNAVDCGPLVNPANGNVSVSSTTYMSTANYNCFTGFRLVGSAVNVCLFDGNWNSSVPYCNLIECGPLSAPANGTVTVSNSTYPSMATYSCYTGFSLIGSATRVCLSDENWNSSAPACNLVDCGPLSDPANGTVALSVSTYLSTATYSCFIGFSLSGSVTRICMSDGYWNSSAPSCTPSMSVSPNSLTSWSTTISSTSMTTNSLSSASTSLNTTSTSMTTNTLSSRSTSPNTTSTAVMSNSSTSGSLATTVSSATAMSHPQRIFIMPCLCYPYKTFTDMTQEEIIAKLIADTEINHKNTTLAKSKLISRNDSRSSSKIIGTVGASILCTVFGLVVFSDLLVLVLKLKAVCSVNQVVPTV